jgi:hypothetical protein
MYFDAWVLPNRQKLLDAPESGIAARLERWRRLCAPRQRNDIPSGIQHVEAIGKALGKLDALGEREGVRD